MWQRSVTAKVRCVLAILWQQMGKCAVMQQVVAMWRRAVMEVRQRVLPMQKCKAEPRAATLPVNVIWPKRATEQVAFALQTSYWRMVQSVAMPYLAVMQKRLATAALQLVLPM